MVTPATGPPAASRTITDGGCATAEFTVAVCPLPALTAMVEATGAGVMVSVTWPLLVPMAAATTTDPADTPVTVPFTSTVAIAELLVDQMKFWPVRTVPAEFVACAVSSIVRVAASVVEGAVTVIAETALRSTTGGGGGGVMSPPPPPPQDRSAAAIGTD